MNITVIGGDMSHEEQQAYVDHVTHNEPGYDITDLIITIDGDYVDLEYQKVTKPFVRLRRITGYLTTTLDKWNDAKRAEEHDRVKHGV